MALRADALRGVGFSSKALEAVVKEQLRIIDNTLQTAEKHLGWNVVRHRLPESFPVPGIDDPAEQQRFIYSQIIISLKERGFVPRLWLADGNSFVIIGYNISFNQEQVDAMNAVLARARIDSVAALESFIDGADAPKNERDSE